MRRPGPALRTRPGAPQKLYLIPILATREATIPPSAAFVVPLETVKGGKKLELTTFRQEPVARGGKGHQLVKRDTMKVSALPPVFVPLPEQPAKEK